MKKQPIGRLALRVEGEFWNAYYAPEHTMEGAILLGSICMSAVLQSDKLKEKFISLMQSVVGKAINDMLGQRPMWDTPIPGPESERAGNA